MPERQSDHSDQAARERRRAALERAAANFGDVPDEVVDTQVGRIDFGTELLGGDAELTEAAVTALERNLERYEEALHDSASPEENVDG